MLNKTKTNIIPYAILILLTAFVFAFSLQITANTAFADEPDACVVTLYDDYGEFINSYTVTSGATQIPSTSGREKTGFDLLGWSLSIDGAIIDPNTYVTEDIELYLVYEFKPLELTFNSFSTTYGNNEYPSVVAEHEANDASIFYKWYKMEGGNPVLLEGATNNFLQINDVVDSGYYQCQATATFERYSDTASKTASVTIQPYPIQLSQLTELMTFMKTYGEEDNLTINLSIISLDEIVEITLIREDGENVGSYEIISAQADTHNFEIDLDMQQQFVIYKADHSYDFAFIDDQTFVYDGEEQMLEYTAVLPEGVTLNISMIGDGVSAGAHYVTADFVLEDSHNYNSIPPITSTMYIEKAYYDLSNTSFISTSVPYDGMPHNIYMSGTLPHELTVNYSQSDIVNAGEYLIIINFVADQNHYPINSIEKTLTIYPKSIQPQFLLPEHPVENGQLIEVEVTSDGIIEGDTVNFNVLSNKPLIKAGTYVLTAECNNPNYVLYNKTTVIQIYAESLTNSSESDLDISITAPDGINSDYTLYADKTELGIDVMGRFNKGKIKSAYEVRFFSSDIEVEPDAGFYINLPLSEEYTDKENFQVYFYNQDLDTLEILDCELVENTISFYTESSGYFVLIADVTTLQQNIAADYGGLLRIILYITLGVMLILIVVLSILISRSKKPSSTIPAKPKPTYNIIQLNQAERESFLKKLNNNEFVDWELNRDLPNYAIWEKMLGE